VDALVVSLDARKKQVDSQIADPTLQSQVLALQKELEQQNAKKQELTLARDLTWSSYKTTSSKIEEVRIAQQSSSTIVRLAGSAVVPERPVGSKKTTNALIAATIGFLLSIVFVVLIEFLDPKIHSPQDVSKHLGLATFEVRATDGKSPTPGNLHPSNDYYQMWTSAFSVFPANRAVLIAGNVEKNQGEVAANLGLVAARSGRSVVLVDAGVCAPSLAQIFGLTNEQGWSDLLRDGVTGVGEYLRPTQIDNLQVLTSGAMIDGTEALAVSPRLSEVISALKSQAEIVVFTAAPVVMAPDGLLIAKNVDSVFLLAVAGRTGRGEIIKAKDQLRKANSNLLGVVLLRPVPPTARWGALVQRLAPTWR
jgi:capsular exopolysaccharide synthesis family protein